MTTKIECTLHPEGHVIGDEGASVTGVRNLFQRNGVKYWPCLGEFYLVDCGVDEKGNHRVDIHNTSTPHKHITLLRGEMIEEEALRAQGLEFLRSVRCE